MRADIRRKFYNTPLGRLMHDFSCKNPDDMYYENLAARVRYFKEEEEGTQKMGDVMEKLMAKREKELGHVMEKLMAKREREAVERGKKEMGSVMEKLMAKREREAEKKTAKKERRELAKNLLAENETIERTARLTTLSVAEVRELAEKLSA